MKCNECKNYFRSHNDRSHCGGNFEKSECEDFEQAPDNKEALKVKPTGDITSPNILVGISSVLWRKENEFATFMFQRLYGNLNDDGGIPYIKKYEQEVKELMDNMYIGLSTILMVYNEYYIDDVIKVFISNFWEMRRIVECDYGTLTEIAYRYDELYGASIGDKPTFG